MTQLNGEFSKLFDLSGRAALVTGAAVGFGKVISTGFAQYGCDVAVADIDFKAAQRTAAQVTALGRRAVAIAVDVGRPEQIQAMFALKPTSHPRGRSTGRRLLECRRHLQ